MIFFGLSRNYTQTKGSWSNMLRLNWGLILILTADLLVWAGVVWLITYLIGA